MGFRNQCISGGKTTGKPSRFFGGVGKNRARKPSHDAEREIVWVGMKNGNLGVGWIWMGLWLCPVAQALRLRWLRPDCGTMTDATEVTVEAEPERRVEVPGNDVEPSATTLGPSATMATVEDREGDYGSDRSVTCI